jgi:hypothetical protein
MNVRGEEITQTAISVVSVEDGNKHKHKIDPIDEGLDEVMAAAATLAAGTENQFTPRGEC